MTQLVRASAPPDYTASAIRDTRTAVRSSRNALPYMYIAAGSRTSPPVCEDLDGDCEGVTCKVRCWLHAPERGLCPYLQPQVHHVLPEL